VGVGESRRGLVTRERMLRDVRRRISNLEESIPVRITAEGFLARAHRQATGDESVTSAIASLAHDLSDGELNSLTAEFEQLAFGADFAARDAARHRVLTAANREAPCVSGIEGVCLSRVSDLSSLDNPFNCKVSN
jgi:hypothetical protein